MTLTKLKETLERVGFSSSETKVYISLLRIGSSKAGKLSRECQINRTTTYDALKRLQEKGLASYIVKANRKWFEVVEPRRLLDYLKERENDLQEILPELQKIHKLPKEKHDVTLFYGYRGMKSILLDLIREGGVRRVMDSEEQMARKMPHFAKFFIKQLDKKKILVKHLVRDNKEVVEWWYEPSIKPSKGTQVRFVSKKIPSDAVIDIYRDKVAISIWTDPPEGIIIQNKTVADSFKEYFEMLWKSAKTEKEIKKKYNI
jgi:sugar-specific transcriptional regulator TrmB